jgi:hypothetical protein
MRQLSMFNDSATSRRIFPPLTSYSIVGRKVHKCWARAGAQLCPERHLIQEIDDVKILAIGAHPDDLEYGCAGTLIKHAQRGDDVFMMIITDGAAGGDPEVRSAEQLEAAKIVGARDVFFGGYQDTQFESS